MKEWAWIGALGLIGACSGASVQDEDDGGAGSGGTGTTEPVRIETCEEVNLCGQVFLMSGLAPGEYTDDQRCLLESLRDRAPGWLEVEVVFGDSGSTNEYILTEGDEVILQEHGWQNGVGPWRDEPLRCTLAGADYFQACLDTPDPDCLTPARWIESCGESLAACP